MLKPSTFTKQFRPAIYRVETLAVPLLASAVLTWGQASSCFADPAAEQNPETALLQREIECFQAKDFAKAAMVGKLLLDSYPGNAQARYYYATALVRLNRREEALKEYSQAYSTSTDSKLKSFCRIAIDELSDVSGSKNRGLESKQGSKELPAGQAARLASPAPATNSSTSPETSTSATGGASAHESPAVSVGNSAARQNVDLLQRKANILEEGVIANKHLREKAQADIDHIRQGVAEQLSQIPTQIPGRFRMIKNPEFTEVSTKLNAEASEKIDAINKSLQQRLDETTAFYEKQAASYDEALPNMQTQMKAGNSLIQMTPQNTNPYLRNFMNFDGSVPGALKAKAGSLPTNQTQPADKK